MEPDPFSAKFDYLVLAPNLADPCIRERAASQIVKDLFAIPDQNRVMAQDGKVIIEFYQVGKFVKVSAIDTASLIEASIVGDPAAGEVALKRAAIQKLNYVMERRRERPGERPGERKGERKGEHQSRRSGRASSTR